MAAWYLAKAGLQPIVLERRPEAGGGALTGEIHPGFRVPTLSHEISFHDDIAREMDLDRHGVEWLAQPVQVFAASAGGAPIVLHEDVARTVEGLRHISVKDAAAYPEFVTSVQDVASVLAGALTAPPPDIDKPGARDLWSLLKTGRRFRAVGKRNGYRLLRWLPMPAADFVHEWFETDLLRAAIAGRGVSGTMLGPWSAGSTLVFMLREAHRQLSGGTRAVRGGPGMLTRALRDAAAAAGAEIRTSSAIERILVRNDRVVAVRAAGAEIATDAVLSTADPKSTLTAMLDPLDLQPELAAKVRNYRAHGTLAKVNLALSALPRFAGADASTLSGRIHIGPDIDYLERAFDHAKYGEYSAEPWLELRIPSIADPALAPAGAHVASIYVHYAPYALRQGAWAAARDQLLAATLAVLERHAPGVRSLVVAAQVLTPADLESEYGFSGGHIFHGELAPDQLFTMRPLLGHARYETPIAGLYLGGAGTHPGGFLTGASGRLAARQMLGRIGRQI